MNGSAVLLLVNTGTDQSPIWTAVGVQTGLTRETTRNLIEVSGKDDDHTKWVYGRRDDTVSLEAVYVPDDAGVQALRQALEQKQVIKIRRSEDGTAVEEADALIKSISEEWPDNDKSTVSVDLQLNSEWTAVSS